MAKTPSGYYKIINRLSGMCLAVKDASLLAEARLVQMPDGSGAELLWGTVEPAPKPCPTCCDSGATLCLGVGSNLVVKENNPETAFVQLRAFKGFSSSGTTGGSNIKVNYVLRGNAVNGVDLENLSGQVTVYATNYLNGDTTTPPADGKIYIKTIDDKLLEGVETLFIDLSFPAATLTHNGVAYIVDDDF